MRAFLFFLLGIGAMSFGFSQNFVGTLQLTFQNQGGTSNMRYLIDTDKVALEMQFQATQGDFRLSFAYPYQDDAHILVKTDKSNEKSATIMPLSSLGAKVRNASEYRFIPQNEKKMIAGYMCEKYQLLMPDFVIETWICPQIQPNLSLLSKIFKDEAVIQAMYLYEMKGFPLETTTKMQNGTFVQSQIVSEVKENQVEKQLFELGEYKLISLE